MLLFTYSVLIWLAYDAFVTVSNSKKMLEIVHDASGFEDLRLRITAKSARLGKPVERFLPSNRKSVYLIGIL